MNIVLAIIIYLLAGGANAQSWEEQFSLLVERDIPGGLSVWKRECTRLGGAKCLCDEAVEEIRENPLCWTGWNHSCILTPEHKLMAREICLAKARIMSWTDVGDRESTDITYLKLKRNIMNGEFNTQSLFLIDCLTPAGWLADLNETIAQSDFKKSLCILTCEHGQNDIKCANVTSTSRDIREIIRDRDMRLSSFDQGTQTFPIRTCSGANVFKTIPVPPRRVCTSHISKTENAKHYGNVTFYKMGSTGRRITVCECYRQTWFRRCTVYFFGAKTFDEGFEWTRPDKESCVNQCNTDYMAGALGSSIGSAPDYLCVWTGGRSTSAFIQMTTFSYMIEDLMTGDLTHTGAIKELKIAPHTPVPIGWDFDITRSGRAMTMSQINGTCIFVRGLSASCIIDLDSPKVIIRCPTMNVIATISKKETARVCDSTKLFLTDQYNLIYVSSKDATVRTYFASQALDPRSTIEQDKTVNNDLTQTHINWQADKEARDVNQVAQAAAMSECLQYNIMHDLALSVAEIYPETAIRILMNDDSITGYMNGTVIHYLPCEYKMGKVSKITKDGVHVKLDGDDTDYCLGLPEIEIGRCTPSNPPVVASLNTTHVLIINHDLTTMVKESTGGNLANLHYGPNYIGSRPLFDTKDMHDMTSAGPLRDLITGIAKREAAIQNLTEKVKIIEVKAPLEAKVESMDIGGVAAKGGAWLDNTMVSIFGGSFWGAIKAIVFGIVMIVLTVLLLVLLWKGFWMAKGAYDRRIPGRRGRQRGHDNIGMRGLGSI